MTDRPYRYRDRTQLQPLLTEDPPDQAEIAKAELSQCLLVGVRPKVTDLVLMETYFALQSHYGVPKKEALAALRSLLKSGDVEPVGYSLDVLQKTRNLATAKPGFVDRIIHAELDALGARMLTFEKAAAKLRGVRVL